MKDQLQVLASLPNLSLTGKNNRGKATQKAENPSFEPGPSSYSNFATNMIAVAIISSWLQQLPLRDE